jgi:hypothetical protein
MTKLTNLGRIGKLYYIDMCTTVSNKRNVILTALAMCVVLVVLLSYVFTYKAVLKRIVYQRSLEII